MAKEIFQKGREWFNIEKDMRGNYNFLPINHPAVSIKCVYHQRGKPKFAFLFAFEPEI